MARLHVIYDPNDKLTTQSEHMNRLGIKGAIMPISNELTNDEIGEVGKQIIILLLEQVRLG